MTQHTGRAARPGGLETAHLGPVGAGLIALLGLATSASRAAPPVPPQTPQASRAETRQSSAASGKTAGAQQPKSGGLSSRALDELVAKELTRYGVEPGEPLSDEEFLRRVYLDVTGRIPDVRRIESFLKDKNARKRGRLIHELLETPEYARHWGRYWCDVITFRTRGEDDHLKPESLEDWFTQQLAANTPWNEVVRQLITATGRNDEYGPANFILAQMARPDDLTSETTRVFLGVQLQCAQCHDDPNGHWTRQQFHDMAAFFGRIDEVRVDTGPEPKLPPGVKPPTPPFMVLVLDQARKEYMMPDRDDASKTTPILQPRPLQGPPLPRGLTDAERRGLLATWVTGPINLWFPRAYVNRLWTQLMGSGFTTQVDDMGPGRPVLCPSVLYRVAAAWRTSGHDPRWLLELLLNSRIYQSKITTSPSSEPARFAGVAPTRLQARQILDSLAVALDVPPEKLPADFRTRFARTFEFDPSIPSSQVANTVSQSLAIMNDPNVVDLLDRQGHALIDRLVLEPDDAAVIESLYVRTLVRRPSAEESNQCRAYVSDVGERREAFEDLLWCLLNSTEFLTKR